MRSRSSRWIAIAHCQAFRKRMKEEQVHSDQAFPTAEPKPRFCLVSITNHELMLHWLCIRSD